MAGSPCRQPVPLTQGPDLPRFRAQQAAREPPGGLVPDLPLPATRACAVPAIPEPVPFPAEDLVVRVLAEQSHQTYPDAHPTPLGLAPP